MAAWPPVLAFTGGRAANSRPPILPPPEGPFLAAKPPV